jgi:UrcA family protein
MLLACVLVVSNAFADGQLRTETVNFQDLNVDTSAGLQTLYHRIHAAAKRVCASSGEWAQIREVRCAGEAVAQTVEKLNLPPLTAYYQAKNGGRTEVFTANR